MIDHRPGPARTGASLHCLHHLTPSGAAWRRWPPATAGAVLIVGSAHAFALDGPVAQAAYRQGLDPATFGFWRASAGALVLGGCLAARLRPGGMAGIWWMRRAAAVRLALAAVAGLGLNLALFEAFARLPVAVAVAAFGCYPLFVAAWEAASRRPTAGAARLGLAVVAIAGLMLLIRPDRSASVSIAGLLLALLAAVMFGQLLAPSQLLGGALLLGAGIAVQTVPARPARRSAGVIEPVRDAAGQGWHRE
jgi:drug/metabolite transporter (DMT)-like permease